jgi:hypothetical protein
MGQGQLVEMQDLILEIMSSTEKPNSEFYTITPKDCATLACSPQSPGTSLSTKTSLRNGSHQKRTSTNPTLTATKVLHSHLGHATIIPVMSFCAQTQGKFHLCHRSSSPDQTVLPQPSSFFYFTVSFLSSLEQSHHPCLNPRVQWIQFSFISELTKVLPPEISSRKTHTNLISCVLPHSHIYMSV